MAAIAVIADLVAGASDTVSGWFADHAIAWPSERSATSWVRKARERPEAEQPVCLKSEGSGNS
jgi:hypothetical protein